MQSAGNVAEMLAKVSTVLLPFVSGEGYAKFVVDGDNVPGPMGRSGTESVVLKCFQDSARGMQAMCLWHTRDVFVLARQQKEDGVGEEDGNAGTHSREELLILREILVDMMTSWLSILPSSDLAGEEEEGGHVTLLVRQLQGEAFRMLGDLRLLFPMKLRDDFSPVVGTLAWEASSELVQKMEAMFHREELLMRRALRDLEEEEEEEGGGEEEGDVLTRLVAPSREEQKQHVANQLAWTLLNPLGGINTDIVHMNRRQAACILGYLVYESSQHVQSMVNAWLKKLKEKDMGKYLESMLLALKKVFEECLLTPLQKHSEAAKRIEDYQPPPLMSQRGRGRSEVDQEEALEMEVAVWKNRVHSGWKRVSQLSKRFAQTLGVGKCSGEVAGYVVQLLQVAMKYSLQSIHHLSFFTAGLESFLGHLRAAQISSVRDSLTSWVHALRIQGVSGGYEESLVLEAITGGREVELGDEEELCVKGFLSFGDKIGWDMKMVSQEVVEGMTPSAGGEGGHEFLAAVSSEEAEMEVDIEDEDMSPDRGLGSGRRRAVGGKRSLSRYTSVGDDDNDEGIEETINVTVVADTGGGQSLSSGLHLEDLSQGVSTQSSEQSEDMFAEFDLRRSHRRLE